MSSINYKFQLQDPYITLPSRERVQEHSRILEKEDAGASLHVQGANGGELRFAVLPVLRLSLPAAEHVAGLRQDQHLPAGYSRQPWRFRGKGKLKCLQYYSFIVLIPSRLNLSNNPLLQVVLDVGAGSGILSFFAVQAGAKHVYAVEGSGMAEHCRALIKHNKFEDKITGTEQLILQSYYLLHLSSK